MSFIILNLCFQLLALPVKLSTAESPSHYYYKCTDLFIKEVLQLAADHAKRIKVVCLLFKYWPLSLWRIDEYVFTLRNYYKNVCLLEFLTVWGGRGIAAEKSTGLTKRKLG